VFLLRNAGKAPISAFAGFALALAPSQGQFWKSGVQYANIGAVPGYSFSRSGEQGAYDAFGAASYFVANTPAVNGAGYHAYAALTNNILQSQDFSSASWTKQAVTISADSAVAPDGTTTMDKLAEDNTTDFHSVRQIVTLTGKMTYAIVAKAAERTGIRVLIEGTTTGSGAYADFDLNAGTTGGGNAIVSGTNIAANIISLGGGKYLCVISCDPGAGDTAVTCTVRLLNAGLQNYAGTTGSGLYLWQGQLISGWFDNGGPIIRTTAATATIGASTLSTTANPITVDQDFIWWGVVNLGRHGNTEASHDIISVLGAAGTHFLSRSPTAFLDASISGAANYLSTGAQVANGRYAVMIRRRAGKNTLAYKLPTGVVTLELESGVTGFTAPDNGLTLGVYPGGSDQTDGAIEGVFMRQGTFSDVQIQTILTAA
jgi:hypothetical protein